MNTSVEIVIPVLNEENSLRQRIGELHQFLSHALLNYDWKIIIADNGSSDSTLDIARELSERYLCVGNVHLDQRGRGRALRKTWMESDADIVSYMDLDLSTDLNAFSKLLEAIDKEGYGVATGSRLITGSQVIGRSLKREFFSRAYSLTFRIIFFTKFKDAQCGFKAISRNVAQSVIPLTTDNGWFFDTEFLVLAEKNGFSVKEIPIKWTDDPDTRVKIFRTAYEDLKGLLRLRFGGLKRASKILQLGIKGHG